MGIEQLNGLYLNSFRFSKGSYNLEFAGKLGDTFRSFNVGTSYYLSGDSQNLSDAEASVSSIMWDFLEQKLVSIAISESDDINKIMFHFESGDNIVIWQEQDAIDNLLMT